MNFVAIDFETANSNRSSICSVGLAIVEKGEIINTQHILIKPTPNYYDPFNSALHGISNNITKNKKTFRQQWKDLKQYFNNQTIIAHNAAFDCSVLRYALDKARIKYPDLNYHCTFRLSQVSLNLERYSLDAVSKHFKIELLHHDAESDAKACAIIALRLCDKHKVNSLEELSIKYGFYIGKIISETNSYSPFSKRMRCMKK